MLSEKLYELSPFLVFASHYLLLNVRSSSRASVGFFYLSQQGEKKAQLLNIEINRNA